MTRLRTSQEVYQRIRWDPGLDATAFVIGYEDRGQGLRELPLLAFRPGGRIPWHRVQYVKQGERLVWDRATRLDLVGDLRRDPADDLVPAGEVGAQAVAWDGAAWAPHAGEAAGLPRRLTAVSWNVLQAKFDPAPEARDARHALLLERLRAADADLIALQEVDPEFAARLCAEDWVRADYVASAPPDDPALRPSGQLLLSRFPLADVRVVRSQDARRGVLATLTLGSRALQVASLHLTSAAAGGQAAARRCDDIDLVLRQVGDRDALLLGDYNARAGEPVEARLAEAGLKDVWPALHGAEPGPTFEPSGNPLARAGSLSGLDGRLDRALVRAAWLRPRWLRRLGREAVAGVWASDHAGLRGVFAVEPAALEAAPVYRSAVCLIPPAALWGPIQAIRAAHDQSYARWMPHVNLLYGFLPAEHHPAALPALREVLREVAPFEVELARFERFTHRASATVWLAPEPGEPVCALQERLQARFPRCDEQGRKSERGFTPHLSVGSARRPERAEDLARSWACSWRPLRFLVDHICVIARHDDAPFEVVARAALAGAPVAPGLEPLRRACAQVADAAGVGAPWVQVVGSHALGLADVGDDLDALIVTPAGLSRDDLYAALPDALGLAAHVGGATVPALHVQGSSGAIDVVGVEAPAGVDPAEAWERPALCDPATRRALAAARDAHTLRVCLGEAGATARFRALARGLRDWARARDLRGGAWGYLSGFGWTLLAAWAALRDPEPDDEQALGRCFARLAARAWAEPLTLLDGGPSPPPDRAAWSLASPADPEPINVARQVQASTAAVLQRELARAAAVEPDQRALPLPPGPRLQLTLEGVEPASVAVAWGAVEGAVLRLILTLDTLGAHPRPLPSLRAIRIARPPTDAWLDAARSWAHTVTLPEGVTLRVGGA